MGLDIRWPIGLMFSLIGVLLLIESAAATAKKSADGLSIGVNIDLIWGIVLVIFGVLMLIGAVRGKRSDDGK